MSVLQDVARLASLRKLAQTPYTISGLAWLQSSDDLTAHHAAVNNPSTAAAAAVGHTVCSTGALLCDDVSSISTSLHHCSSNRPSDSPTDSSDQQQQTASSFPRQPASAGQSSANDSAKLTFSREQLDTLALLLTAVKVLFSAGALAAAAELLHLCEPTVASSIEPLHQTHIRNEAAYAEYIAQLLSVDCSAACEYPLTISNANSTVKSRAGLGSDAAADAAAAEDAVAIAAAGVSAIAEVAASAESTAAAVHAGRSAAAALKSAGKDAAVNSLTANTAESSTAAADTAVARRPETAAHITAETGQHVHAALTAADCNIRSTAAAVATPHEGAVPAATSTIRDTGAVLDSILANTTEPRTAAADTAVAQPGAAAHTTAAAEQQIHAASIAADCNIKSTAAAAATAHAGAVAAATSKSAATATAVYSLTVNTAKVSTAAADTAAVAHPGAAARTTAETGQHAHTASTAADCNIRSTAAAVATAHSGAVAAATSKNAGTDAAVDSPTATTAESSTAPADTAVVESETAPWTGAETGQHSHTADPAMLQPAAADTAPTSLPPPPKAAAVVAAVEDVAAISSSAAAVEGAMSDLDVAAGGRDGVVYFCGDSHCLSGAWRTIHVAGKQRLIQPLLVTGLKIWHLRESSTFYTKQQFWKAIEAVPRGSHVVMILGEIDCREGLLTAVEKLKYPSLEHAIQATVDIYIAVLQKLMTQYDLNIYVHPVPPTLDETLKIVEQFEAVMKQAVQAAAAAATAAAIGPESEAEKLSNMRHASPSLCYLDFANQLLSADGSLKAELQFDGTHLHPMYLPHLGMAMHSHMGVTQHPTQ